LKENKQFTNRYLKYLHFDLTNDMVYLCVRSKLKVKNAWGGNTVTLPGVFFITIKERRERKLCPVGQLSPKKRRGRGRFGAVLEQEKSPGAVNR
jgi:hypothetical protein